MDRLARFGQGWIPWGDDAADVTSGIARMRTAVRERNREPETLQVVGTLRPARTDAGGPDYRAAFADVPRLRDAGVTDFRVHVPNATDPRETAELLGIDRRRVPGGERVSAAAGEPVRGDGDIVGERPTTQRPDSDRVLAPGRA